MKVYKCHIRCKLITVIQDNYLKCVNGKMYKLKNVF